MLNGVNMIIFIQWGVNGCYHINESVDLEKKVLSDKRAPNVLITDSHKIRGYLSQLNTNYCNRYKYFIWNLPILYLMMFSIGISGCMWCIHDKIPS